MSYSFFRIDRRAPTTGWFAGAVLGAVALGVPGCSSDGDWRFGGGRPRADGTDVNVVYDREIDFSRYRTFAFRDDAEADVEMVDALDAAARRDLALVNRRVEAELNDLGLVEVASDEADLLAFSLARTQSARGVTWYCVSGAWGGYWGWGWYYDPCAWLQPAYVEVDRTTLMVGLLDPDLSEVTFAGFIRGLGSFRGNRSRQITSAVERIFDRYPARPADLTPDAGAAPGLDAGAPDSDDAATTALDAGPSTGDAGALAGDAGDAGNGGAEAP